ncbi:MAG: FprA family A-type flavoprotein [Oscillospiraceae bacterium]|nr:FprA family A-type flavoprotein [Oscillospiraceae bacterium]
MTKLDENLFYVGVKHPSLEYFDVIVPTDMGTTYNSYLLRGEKTVLFETVHNDFSEEFIRNIEEICPLSEIDIIVCDHTEPDHSGSLGAVLSKAPNATVYGSAPALKNLKNILNSDFPSVVAKNGLEVDAGGFTLRFLSAPNLHWPDSVFTYVPELKTVFTCDFLGCHYCGELSDGDIEDREKYLAELDRYYKYIFSPFAAAVKKGVEIIRGIAPERVCSSHGPVLCAHIDDVIARYDEKASAAPDPDLASVFYVSCYGYTALMAKALAEGMRDGGKTVQVFDISNTDKATLAQAVSSSSFLAFGSPTLNRDALPPVYEVLSMVSAVADRGKPALIFGSYGWSGEACANLSERAKGLGLKVDEELMKVCFRPADEDLKALREKGRAFVS